MAEAALANDPVNTQLAAGFTEFLRGYSAPGSGKARDMLDNRYRIELSSPLPDFDTRTARAYAAGDTIKSGKPLMALVCRADSVQRHRLIPILKANPHPNMMHLVASGIVALTQPDEERFVLIYERPAGKRLSQMLAAREIPRNEHFLITRVLSPIAAAIGHLEHLELSHGNINPDTVFLDEKQPVLGDCISQPCGYSQPFYFEPIERMQAMPAGKGEGDTSHDFYALAVLLLYILHGPEHFSDLTQAQLTRSILKDGVYNALTRYVDNPLVFDDFLRGLLTQSSRNRWDYRYVKPWLDGKRYNVLTPTTPPETARSFEFDGTECYNVRQLAHALYGGWAQIPEAMHDLAHWVAVTLRSKELTEGMSRITRSLGDIDPKDTIQLYEQLMRVILMLDPDGPIRIEKLSFFIDGMDTLAADLMVARADKELQLLAKCIEFNLTSFWIDMQKRDTGYEMPERLNAAITRLDRLRISIRNTGLGFGLERMLYELNPNMPCMSPLLAGRYVNTLPLLLAQLDRLAPALSGQDPIDRHIAAFMAAKLGQQHEIRLAELGDIPTLAASPAVLALRMLASAQRKTDLVLPGLTHWLGLRILPALDHVQSKSLRQEVKLRLLRQAQSGYTQELAQLVLTSGYAPIDHDGYLRAMTLYNTNAARIESYRRGDHLDEYSYNLGFVIASTVAYAALLYMLISVIGSAL